MELREIIQMMLETLPDVEKPSEGDIILSTLKSIEERMAVSNEISAEILEFLKSINWNSR
jgi:hypothetical protein